MSKRPSSIPEPPKRPRRETPLYYHDYLQLDKILGAQATESARAGNPVHDEHMFIVVHQAYELWFKQILLEVNSIIDLLFKPSVEAEDINVINYRLSRVVTIMRLCVEQMSVTETISALDFLEFRDYLIPASGFQSTQFRLLEVKLGLKTEQRTKYQQTVFTSYFQQQHAELIHETESTGRTLIGALEQWASRMPFLNHGNFQWWSAFREGVDRMLHSEEELAHEEHLNAEQAEHQTTANDSLRAHFAAMWDEKRHDELVEKGDRRISLRALQAMLFIMLYRDEAIMNGPNTLLQLIIELDELISRWRFRHCAMVSRMIGARRGTGGSGGYSYLRTTLGSRYRVFNDIVELSTFLIPRALLPPLPETVKRDLGFAWQAAAKSPFISFRNSARPSPQSAALPPLSLASLAPLPPAASTAADTATDVAAAADDAAANADA